MLPLVRPASDHLRRTNGSGFAILLTNKDLNSPDRAFIYRFGRRDIDGGLTAISSVMYSPLMGADDLDRMGMRLDRPQ